MKKIISCILIVALLFLVLACSESSHKPTEPEDANQTTTAMPEASAAINKEMNNLLDKYDTFIEEMRKESERLEGILDEGDRIKSEYYRWVSESITFVKPLLESRAPAEDDLISLVEAWVENGDAIAVEAISYTRDIFSEISEEMGAIMMDKVSVHRDNYHSAATELLDRLKSSQFSANEIYELYEEIVDHLLMLADPESKLEQ